MLRTGVIVGGLAALAFVPATTFAAPETTAPPPPAAPTAAQPAKATDGAKTDTSGEAKRKARDDEIICYNYLNTGSHVGRTRVCMTKAERDRHQSEGKDAMDKLKEAGRTPFPFQPGS